MSDPAARIDERIWDLFGPTGRSCSPVTLEKKRLLLPIIGDHDGVRYVDLDQPVPGSARNWRVFHPPPAE
jgi:hypothetical protein